MTACSPDLENSLTSPLLQGVCITVYGTEYRGNSVIRMRGSLSLHFLGVTRQGKALE